MPPPWSLCPGVGHPQRHDPCCHIATLSAAVSCLTVLPACEGRREAAATRRALSNLGGWGCLWWWERALETGRPDSVPGAAHALSKSGDSSKPSFPCLFGMDNRIRRRKRIVCVWHIASVQYMSVTTRAGFLGLNILQLPKAQTGSTEALRICHAYPEILTYKRLLLDSWSIHL